MDWCVKFPKETILIARPSLRKACGGNRNAAKLLSYLLFCASNQEVKLDKQLRNCIIIHRTQGQIVEDMDEELSTRTLRDEAIPCLTELGYISTEQVRGDKQYTIFYIYHEAIQQGINKPEKVTNFKDLPYSQSKRDRKNFRAENSPNGSEVFPNGSENSPNPEHDPPGNFSEPQNGNGGASQEAGDGQSDDAKNKEDIDKINKREAQNFSSHKNKGIPDIANQTVRLMMGEYGVKHTAECIQRIADVYEHTGRMNGIKFHTAIKDAKAKVSPVAEDRFEEFIRYLCKETGVEYVSAHQEQVASAGGRS